MAANRQTTARRRQGGKGKPFVKGDPRANLKGRPPLTPTEIEVRELARQKSISCVERLDKLGKGKGSTAVRANEILLDRAWGKAKQPLEHSGSLEALTDEQLQARLRVITSADSVAAPPEEPKP